MGEIISGEYSRVDFPDELAILVEIFIGEGKDRIPAGYGLLHLTNINLTYFTFEKITLGIVIVITTLIISTIVGFLVYFKDVNEGYLFLGTFTFLVILGLIYFFWQRKGLNELIKIRKKNIKHSNLFLGKLKKWTENWRNVEEIWISQKGLYCLNIKLKSKKTAMQFVILGLNGEIELNASHEQALMVKKFFEKQFPDNKWMI